MLTFWKNETIGKKKADEYGLIVFTYDDHIFGEQWELPEGDESLQREPGWVGEVEVLLVRVQHDGHVGDGRLPAGQELQHYNPVVVLAKDVAETGSDLCNKKK